MVPLVFVDILREPFQRTSSEAHHVGLFLGVLVFAAGKGEEVEGALGHFGGGHFVVTIRLAGEDHTLLDVGVRVGSVDSWGGR